MSARVRIGAVSYLNARPLVFGMEQGLGADRITLSFDVPSQLADRLAAGDLDVALLPVIELGRVPGLVTVPGLAVGSFGACRSVVLIARQPLDRVRSVALDPESRTSNVLVQVLAREHWSIDAVFSAGPPDLDTALVGHDAAVRIGDKALFEPIPAGATAYDLGEAWTSWTGLPFVFAVWAAREGVVDRDLYETLHASRRAAGPWLTAIATDYTWKGRQAPEIARAYLSEAIRYRLGGPEVDAMNAFLAAASRCGFIGPAPRVRLASFSAVTCGSTPAAPSSAEAPRAAREA